MKRHFLAFSLGLLALATVAAACASPAQTPTSTPLHTATAAPTVTPVPTDTPLLTPTDTPRPTQTPTSVPTPTLTPTLAPTLTPTLTPTLAPTPTLAQGDTVVQKGKTLATQQGCTVCHSTDGRSGIGPTWKGLFGAKVTLSGGSSATADDLYLRESIENPNAKIVSGFSGNVMPTGFGTALSQDDITAIVEYIKTLK